MSIFVDLSDQPGDRWEPITLGDAGDFELLVRPPDFAEFCRDMDRNENILESRIRATVRGWRGISRPVASPAAPNVAASAAAAADQTEPIPYSVDALKVVCTKFRTAYFQIARLMNRLYLGLDEDHSKNCDVPPAGSSTDRASGIPQSGDTSTNDESAVSAPTSV